MPNLDLISVARLHLEEIHRAIDAAYRRNSANDIVREYDNLGGMHRPSNLTRALEKALQRVEGYLVELEKGEEDGSSE